MSNSEIPTSSKLVSEPKEVYRLTIENLSHLVAYSPNAINPDSLISTVDLPPGAYFASITAATEAPGKRWSTVQVSKQKHMELNSALMYMNHSCAPSLEIDTDMMEIRVSKNKDLRVGDELSFFYPSTEYEMDKPFNCLCGASACLGTVTGAAQIEWDTLKTFWVNEHIIKLKQEQAQETNSETRKQ